MDLPVPTALHHLEIRSIAAIANTVWKDKDMSDHEHHASLDKTYLMVFFALCGFTVISVVADLVHLPNKVALGAIVLAVAVCKALCVMMYFMHLKFERAWKYLLLAPTMIIAAALPVSLRPDIGETYYTPDVQQLRDYPEHEAAMQQLHHAEEAGGAAEHH